EHRQGDAACRRLLRSGDVHARLRPGGCCRRRATSSARRTAKAEIAYASLGCPYLRGNFARDESRPCTFGLAQRCKDTQSSRRHQGGRHLEAWRIIFIAGIQGIDLATNKLVEDPKRAFAKLSLTSK